jgi:hypothetical protein
MWEFNLLSHSIHTISYSSCIIFFHDDAITTASIETTIESTNVVRLSIQDWITSVLGGFASRSSHRVHERLHRGVGFKSTSTHVWDVARSVVRSSIASRSVSNQSTSSSCILRHAKRWQNHPSVQQLCASRNGHLSYVSSMHHPESSGCRFHLSSTEST